MATFNRIYENATEAVAGLLSAADKAKLDGLPSAFAAAVNALISSASIAASQITGSVAVKRRWVATFYQNSTTTGQDLPTVVVAPSGPSNASVTWVPKLAYLRSDTPGSGATTAQVVYGTMGNAAFGGGTNILASSLSISGSSAYEASTSSMAAVTVASGTPIAADWIALSASNSILQIEFEASY